MDNKKIIYLDLNKKIIISLLSTKYGKYREIGILKVFEKII